MKEIACRSKSIAFGVFVLSLLLFVGCENKIDNKSSTSIISSLISIESSSDSSSELDITLEDYKENANLLLTQYVDNKGKANYCLVAWHYMLEIVANAKEEILLAIDVEGVDLIVLNKRIEIDQVEIIEDYNMIKTLVETDYFTQTGSETSILSYYGTFAGSIVVRVDRSCWEIITNIEIGGVAFSFMNANLPLVWSEGYLYEFEEAYLAGLLTVDDLEALATAVNWWLKQ